MPPSRSTWSRRRNRRPLGAIDWPAAGSTLSPEAFTVTGWALMPGTTVARVEVRVDGVSAGLARIGLPRPDIAARGPTRRSEPQAPVCGFEHRVAPSAVREDGQAVSVDAIAHGVDGSCLALSAVVCHAAAFEREILPTDPRIAGLRERVRRVSGGVASTKDLRLLVFASTLGSPGGCDLHHLLLSLVKEPSFSAMVLAAEPGPFGRKLEDAGVPVHLTSDCSASEPERYEGRIAELAAWAGARGFNVSLVDGPHAAMGVDLAMRLGIPVVWSASEDHLDPLGPREGPVDAVEAHAGAERALTSAAAVVFTSAAARAPFVRRRGSDRMVTLRPSADAEEVERYKRKVGRRRARRLLGLPEDAILVVCLETMAAQGGQVPLAQAFAGIAERHPGVVLALPGDHASGYSRGLREYVDRAGMTAGVVIAPEPEDPYLWLRAADLLVCSSDRPTSPLAALEAMAFETTVLATRASGLDELIDDGENGYLCDARAVDQLAVGLQRALEASGRERKSILREARRRSAETHRPDARSSGVGRILRALLEDPRARPSDVLSSSRTLPGGALRTVPETVSVMIPTLDAGPGFARSLECLLAQRGVGGLEIVVVDSGSTDDTVAVARAAGARVTEIGPSEFNHGRVRNQLAGLSQGDVLLATVQDAAFTSSYAVRDLVLGLREDARLAAMSALQVPGAEADLHSTYQAWRHKEVLFRRPSPPEGTSDWAEALVDDVCVAIRRPAWEQVRFRELPYGEDIDFGIRAIGQGWRTAFAERVSVEHHHDRGAGYLMRRAAIHRLLLAEVLVDLERLPEGDAGIDAMASALPSSVGQLEAAMSLAIGERASVTLGPVVETLKVLLRGDLPSTEATGELASLCTVIEDGTGPVDPDVVKRLTTWITHALFDPWLPPFALARPEPVRSEEVRSFVARLAASNLGQLLGDAMRDQPGSALAARLGRGI